MDGAEVGHKSDLGISLSVGITRETRDLPLSPTKSRPEVNHKGPARVPVVAIPEILCASKSSHMDYSDSNAYLRVYDRYSVDIQSATNDLHEYSVPIPKCGESFSDTFVDQ